jgi:hypothetical protein
VLDDPVEDLAVRVRVAELLRNVPFDVGRRRRGQRHQRDLAEALLQDPQVLVVRVEVVASLRNTVPFVDNKTRQLAELCKFERPFDVSRSSEKEKAVSYLGAHILQSDVERVSG